jgi:hypothetical protein
MKKISMPDFHHVDDDQLDIHDRLLNWARWVTPRTSSTVSPMFRQYRSHAWQWHTPDHRPTCDTLDALLVEKTMRLLPLRHREAVRWAYVYRCSPAIAIRELALSYDGLARYVRDGRMMVRNLASK